MKSGSARSLRSLRMTCVNTRSKIWIFIYLRYEKSPEINVIPLRTNQCSIVESKVHLRKFNVKAVVFE